MQRHQACVHEGLDNLIREISTSNMQRYGNKNFKTLSIEDMTNIVTMLLQTAIQNTEHIQL